jgi:mono/diheme cytochrome c family protein
MLLFVLSGPAGSLPWDKDMVDQPVAKAQRTPAPAEPDAVPIVGGENLPAPDIDDEQAMDAAKDEAASLSNPIPATAESLERGEYLYEMNCLVCHGSDGTGEGPVGQKFVTKAPVDLHDEYTQDQADGSIFFTLTRGRALMPAYRDALSVEERWHVINYIRREFGNQ